MSTPGSSAFTLGDLRQVVRTGQKLAMLTAYDFTTAGLLAAAGVRMLLVGDSAANVILGYRDTTPVSLEFMIEITAAVRRGAPDALVLADLPFGVAATTARGIRETCRMVKLSQCDCVKIETTRGHIGLVQGLADNGVAVFAHLGLTPQGAGLMGGYKARGRTASEALEIADLATDLVNAGAAGVLLEAVPPQVASLVIQQVNGDPDRPVPVIGCGAGPACHAHVVVTHDLLGLTDRPPRFVPRLADLGPLIGQAAERYIMEIASGKYPAKPHMYQMANAELEQLRAEVKSFGIDL